MGGDEDEGLSFDPRTWTRERPAPPGAPRPAAPPTASPERPPRLRVAAAIALGVVVLTVGLAAAWLHRHPAPPIATPAAAGGAMPDR